jgi:RecB family endonuclease NucS
VVALSSQIRLWRITDKGFEELNRGSVEQEKELHDWLEGDISLISGDLLVIGWEVLTDFNKSIDLLCLDGNGDVVIVELKRDRAPRDVLAQILEYASWVDDLPSERILDIANEYLQKKGQLSRKRFNRNLEYRFLNF